LKYFQNPSNFPYPFVLAPPQMQLMRRRKSLPNARAALFARSDGWSPSTRLAKPLSDAFHFHDRRKPTLHRRSDEKGDEHRKLSAHALGASMTNLKAAAHAFNRRVIQQGYEMKHSIDQVITTAQRAVPGEESEHEIQNTENRARRGSWLDAINSAGSALQQARLQRAGLTRMEARA